jgi:hypothetical protein
MKNTLTLAVLTVAMFMISSVSYAYTVKRGDTMYKIASASNLSLSQLFALNPLIKSHHRIYPGESVNTSSSSTEAAQTALAVSKHKKLTYVKPVATTSVPTLTPTTTSTPVVTPVVPTPVVIVPVPTPVVLPQPTAGETRLAAYLTGYSYWDNTPAGSSDISNPVIHQKAGGTGTYADPVTLAVGHTITGGKDILDYKEGTKFYVPNLRKYFIVEDTCGDGNTPQNGPCHSGYQGHVWLDLYVDGATASRSQSDSCMNAITDIHTVIQNPASSYAVIAGDLSANCKQYGDTIVIQ